MLTADRLAGLALFGLALLIVWQARGLPFGSLRQPGPGYAPTLLALVLALLGLVVAAAGRDSPPLRALRWPEARRAGVILAACAAAAFALERLGFRLTVLLLTGLLVGAVERRPPLLAAAVAVALSLGSYFLFATLLKVPLPRGPLGF
ncbi:MAG TPA: tripartite tricarboxylate transporter TctB family protein [Thermodesulfobacteriota bacterium]|nr:tripartite tricarboxylate transporter TctB family protein [Thermodesulfobacteriota bacterium]